LSDKFNWPVNGGDILYVYVRNTITSSWYKRYLPLELDLLESIGYPTKVDGYYTMDLIARYSFSRNLQFFLQLFNVFDAQYGGIGAYGSQHDLRYNPQYGRSFKLGFSFRLE
jgi:hemoglobin/transferrin/lactoferrin receptor protein